MSKKEKKTKDFKLIVLVSIVGVLTILLLLSSFVIKMYFIDEWTQGDAPFIIFFLKDVVIIGFWGSLSVLFGLFILFGSTYLIVTKKAAKPKKLVGPAAFLTVFCFGFAYLLLGTGWIESVRAAATYYSQGPTETTIILQNYEVIKDMGKFEAANEYVYTSTEGEKFRTNTDFNLPLNTNKEYRITYLPEANYLISIQPE